MTLRQHIFNFRSGKCLYCEVYNCEPLADLPCDEAPDHAPEFKYDAGEIMAYYNLSDEQWDGLPKDVQDKLYLRTID